MGKEENPENYLICPLCFST